jgi:hypothetical protein
MDSLEMDYCHMDDGRIYCRAEIDLTTLKVEWAEIESRVFKSFNIFFNEEIKSRRKPDDLVSTFVDIIYDCNIVCLNAEFIPRDFYEKWRQEDPNKREMIFMIRV